MSSAHAFAFSCDHRPDRGRSFRKEAMELVQKSVRPNSARTWGKAATSSSPGLADHPRHHAPYDPSHKAENSRQRRSPSRQTGGTRTCRSHDRVLPRPAARGHLRDARAAGAGSREVQVLAGRLEGYGGHQRRHPGHSGRDQRRPLYTPSLAAGRRGFARRPGRRSARCPRRTAGGSARTSSSR